MSKPGDAHAVLVEGDALRSFNSRANAMAFAQSKVYLSPERIPDMEALLDAGQLASWCYGFSGVYVYPGIP